uniref:Uncharacterized protein n=1 Tax=Arundo donax TaxID=35708 RepID=A0A0A9CJE1_ARUDO
MSSIQFQVEFFYISLVLNLSLLGVNSFLTKAFSGRLGFYPCQPCSLCCACRRSISFLWQWLLQNPESRWSPGLWHNQWDKGYGPSQEAQTSSYICETLQ